MSPSNATTWEQNLRNLTEQADRAAVLGRWDQVEECYRLRGMHLQDHPVGPALVTDLTAFDMVVAARIVMARAAIESQLIETAKVRQNLHGLRSWQDLGATEPSHMNHQA